MQDSAIELRRIPVPRNRVNKGQRKAEGHDTRFPQHGLRIGITPTLSLTKHALRSFLSWGNTQFATFLFPMIKDQEVL
jgi:hypothetical protein